MYLFFIHNFAQIKYFYVYCVNLYVWYQPANFNLLLNEHRNKLLMQIANQRAAALCSLLLISICLAAHTNRTLSHIYIPIHINIYILLAFAFVCVGYTHNFLIKSLYYNKQDHNLLRGIFDEIYIFFVCMIYVLVPFCIYEYIVYWKNYYNYRLFVYTWKLPNIITAYTRLCAFRIRKSFDLCDNCEFFNIFFNDVLSSISI